MNIIIQELWISMLQIITEVPNSQELMIKQMHQINKDFWETKNQVMLLFS